MRNILIFTFIAIVFISLSFTKSNNLQEKSWNNCVEKYRTEWSQPCDKCTYSEDIYKAFYKNICDQKVDILIALQERDKKWNCFYRFNIAPNDTTFGFACKGTGKSLYWVREAGDKQTSFPTKEEINRDYK